MITSLKLGRTERQLPWPTSTAKGTNTQALQKVSEESDMEKVRVMRSVALYTVNTVAPPSCEAAVAGTRKTRCRVPKKKTGWFVITVGRI